jgi:hypothetical protein
MRFATLVGAALLVGGCSGSSKDTAAGTGISPTDSTPPLDTDTITDTDSETPVDCDSRPLELAPPRGEVGGVWDAAKGRMVFFAGDQGLPNNCITQTDIIGDTWAFHPDCDNFEQLSVGSGPVSRARHGVAYDADGNRMIVHGGRFREGTSGTYEVLDDIWAFDLSTDTWTELPSSGGPAARHSHATWVSGGKLYVYAGNGSNDGAFYQALPDMWSYDLASGTWTELESSSPAGTRIFPGYAAAADGSQLYVYGGTMDFFGPTVGDLWAYDVEKESWTELNAGGSGAPIERFGPNITVDDAGGRVFLWSGHDTTDLGNTNQVWSFDLAEGSWSELSVGDVVDAGSNGFCDFPYNFTEPDLSAPERRYLGMAVSTGTELMMFGGKTDCGIINDVWTWSYADGGWTERSSATSGEICLRAFAECSSLCF